MIPQSNPQQTKTQQSNPQQSNPPVLSKDELKQQLLSFEFGDDEDKLISKIESTIAVNSDNLDWLNLPLIAEKGISKVLRYCIETLKCNVNFEDDQKNTLLHIAAREGHFRTVRSLLDLSANVHALNVKGEKPIDVVSIKKGQGCSRMIKKVMNSGSETKMTNSHRIRRRNYNSKPKAFEWTQELKTRWNNNEARTFIPCIDEIPEDTIRVVSYNVLAQAYTKQSYFPWTNDLTFESRWKRIETMLNKLKADVFALQEVDQPKTYEDYFKQRNYCFFFKKRNGSRKDGCVLAVRKELFQSYEAIDLNDYVPQHLRPQNIIAQVMTLKNGLVILNTHLYYKDGRLRLHDTKELIKRASSYKHVICCGDWNFGVNSTEYKTLQEAQLTDVYATSNAPFQATTFASASRTDGLFLDHLFISPSIKVARRLVLPSQSMLLPNELHGSDHIPVAADIFLK